MKLNKKSQDVGRSVILLMIVMLAVVIVMMIIFWEGKGEMINWIDKIFG